MSLREETSTDPITFQAADRIRRFPKRVHIVEVGPRDGLQNEEKVVPLETKRQFIHLLMEAGLSEIEMTSFVRSDRMPQLADADELAASVAKHASTVFSALVPNERGLDRALAAKVNRIAVFTAASETFAKRNINMTIDQSLATFKSLIQRAGASGITVRAYLSCCFMCPYEGDTPKEKVRDLTQQLLNLGADQVVISDTLGAAAPSDLYTTVGYVMEQVPSARLALHLHDTYGTALANVLAGLELGITTFDSSAGGLGGCPYAPGAAGNLATEDLVYMLQRMGVYTGVDLQRTISAAAFITSYLDKVPTSRQLRRCARSSTSE